MAYNSPPEVGTVVFLRDTQVYAGRQGTLVYAEPRKDDTVDRVWVRLHGKGGKVVVAADKVVPADSAAEQCGKGGKRCGGSGGDSAAEQVRRALKRAADTLGIGAPATGSKERGKGAGQGAGGDRAKPY